MIDPIRYDLRKEFPIDAAPWWWYRSLQCLDWGKHEDCTLTYCRCECHFH